MNIDELARKLHEIERAHKNNKYVSILALDQVMDVINGITIDDLEVMFTTFQWNARNSEKLSVKNPLSGLNDTLYRFTVDSLIKRMCIIEPKEVRHIPIITNMLKLTGMGYILTYNPASGAYYADSRNFLDKKVFIQLLNLLSSMDVDVIRDNDRLADLIQQNCLEEIVGKYSSKEQLNCVQKILNMDAFYQQPTKKILRFLESLPANIQEMAVQEIFPRCFNYLLLTEIDFLFGKLPQDIQQTIARKVLAQSSTRFQSDEEWYLLEKLSVQDMLQYFLPTNSTFSQNLRKNNIARYFQLLDSQKDLIAPRQLVEILQGVIKDNLYQYVPSSQTIDVIISLLQICQLQDASMDLLLPPKDFYKNRSVLLGEFIYKISQSEAGISLSPQQIKWMKHGKESLLSYFDQLTGNSEKKTFFAEASNKNGQLWRIFHARRGHSGDGFFKMPVFEQLKKRMTDLGLELESQSSILPSVPFG